MNLQEVQQLKLEADALFRQEMVELFVKERKEAALAGTNAVQPWRCPPMVGYSSIEPGKYKLAVRVRSLQDLPHQTYENLVSKTRASVDLRVVGTIKLLVGEGPGYRHWRCKTRPLMPGLSIGQTSTNSPKPNTGTLGCFVKKRGGSGLFLLSNRHIIAEPNPEIGTSIIQPGIEDRGHSEQDIIATLSESIGLAQKQSGETNFNKVDAAIAKLHPKCEIHGNRVPDLGIIISSVKENYAGEAIGVLKVGRTSGLTRGTITASGLDVHVQGGLAFENQIEISGIDRDFFAKGGDSGSLVIDERSGEAIGLLFAVAENGTAYANRIDTVFHQLQIDFP